MRKLATIQKIERVVQHPNADNLDICTILGWKVVTRRNEFAVGDMCVYCEIDSVMPDKPEFEFLRARKFRINTVKLRGQVSQGICFPLSILPDDGSHNIPGLYDNVTDILGITKYEPTTPANLCGNVRGPFPAFLHKTDEIRIQNIPEIIDTLIDVPMYVTEKLDGSSATFYVYENRFGVCSRNLDLDYTDNNSFYEVSRLCDIENKLRSTGKNISIQGELVGDAIQGNKLKLNGLHFYAFQVYDIDAMCYYGYDEFITFCENVGFTTVPIIDDNFKTLASVDDYVSYANAKSTINPSVDVEGFVFRSKSSKILHNPSGRISFKCINMNYLLKHEDV